VCKWLFGFWGQKCLIAVKLGEENWDGKLAVGILQNGFDFAVFLLGIFCKIFCGPYLQYTRCLLLNLRSVGALKRS
jgi:hypothetical protein